MGTYEDLLTIQEAAELLKVHPNTLRHWEREKILLPISLPGKRFKRYKKQAIIDLLQENDRDGEEQKAPYYRLSQVLDSLFMFVGLLTPDGILVEANKAALEAAGLESEEVVDKPFWETYWWSYSNESKARLQKSIAQAKKGGRVRYDVKVRVANDEYITIDFSLVPIIDKAGKVEYLVPSGIDVTERTRVEEVMKLKEQRFRQLANSMPQLVWTADPDGTVDYYNDRYKNFKGIKKVVGEYEWRLVVHPEDIDQTLEAWRRAVQLGISYEMEHRIKMKGGNYKWFLSRAVPVTDDEGSVIKWFGTATDIDEQKRYQEKLFEERERLLLAEEAGNIGSFEWNIQKDINIWSRELEEIYGLESGEFSGTYKAWLSMLHPDDRTKAKKDVKKAMETGEFNSEWRVVRHDGSIRYIFAKGKVFKDKKGKPEWMVGINMDVTDQRKNAVELQQRLKQQEVVSMLGLKALSGADLKELMDLSVTELRNVLDTDYAKVLELLPSGEVLLLRAGSGWKKHIKVDKTMIDTGGNSQAGVTLNAKHPIIVEDLRTDKRFTGPPLLMEHEVVSGMSCIIYGSIRPYGVLGVHSRQKRKFTKDDINFLQSVANVLAMAIQRKRDEQQKDEFIGVASHELKTPVTSIKAYTQVLAKMFENKGDRRSAEYLLKMDGQINKLTGLVSDLLDVTKIEAGKLRLRKSEFEINDLVQEIVDQMQLTTDRHTLQLQPGPDQMLVGDRDRIGQVMINLLGNAIKYSPRADTVDISSERKNGSVVITVRDYGVGIPFVKQQDLFQRFYRVEDRDENIYPGVGLGLYISHEIITRHKGEIWYKDAKGDGSIFGFSLPLGKKGGGDE